MRDISEIIDVIEKWVDDGCVGNLVIYHPPNTKKFGAYIEQTVKLRELNEKLAGALETIVDAFKADRGEFYCDKDGKPDRIKIIKAI